MRGSSTATTGGASPDEEHGTPGAWAGARLAGGLRVLAVRLPTVPRTELRLTVPLTPPQAGPSATAAVLACTLLRGVPGLDRAGFDTELGLAGADLVPLARGGALTLRGGVLAPGLERALGLTARALAAALHTGQEVRAARTALAAQLGLAHRTPGAAARALLLRLAHGDHPGARELPAPDEVAAVTAERVRALHLRRVVPDRAALVLVGDLAPRAAVAAARRAFADWAPGTAGMDEQEPPAPGTAGGTGRIQLFGEPGGPTAQLRLCAPMGAAPPGPALRLAAAVLGGSPAARLARTLRERLGHTYDARAVLEEGPAGTRLMIEADTAPQSALALAGALGEELAGLAERPPTAAEVAAARGYLTGCARLARSTQSGLADALCALPPDGREPAALDPLLTALARTTPHAVASAARELFAPSRFTGVLVGARHPDGARSAGPWPITRGA